jgi:hypothetical protein
MGPTLEATRPMLASRLGGEGVSGVVCRGLGAWLNSRHPCSGEGVVVWSQRC